MKRALVVLCVAAAMGGCGAEDHLVSSGPSGLDRVDLPLAFEEDGGRTDAARFQVRGPGGTLYLGDRGATFTLGAHGGKQAAVGLALPAARSGLRPQGERRLRGVVNSYVGNDRRRWRTGLSTYEAVRYRRVWPGVDLLFHGRRSALEYDFVVAPGADPSRVALRVSGGKKPRLDRGGRLVVATDAGRFVQRRPRVFQRIGSRTVRVPGRFALDGRTVRFALGRYDRSRPLVIDPVILYSTFNGGAADEDAYDVTVDSSGQAIVVGRTLSTNFPTASPADNTADGTNGDAFVTKLGAGGNSRVFSTYLGGTLADKATAVAVNNTDLIGVAGTTSSTNFPTAVPTQANNAGDSDAFAAVLSTTGTLNFSTYYGGTGTEEANAAIWHVGVRFTIGGETTSTGLSWPGTPFDPSHNGGNDGFVTRWVGPAPNYAVDTGTYIGGSASDDIQGLAQDTSNRLLVAGITTSPFFPVPGTPLNGDAYVMRLNSFLATQDLALRHGGSGVEEDVDLATDGSQRPVLSGTTSSSNLPTANAIDSTLSGTHDAFLARFTTTGTLDTATYLGDGQIDGANDVTVAPSGNIWLVGYTGAGPTSFDAVVWRLASTALSVLSQQRLEGVSFDAQDAATGVATDSGGNAYVTGSTRSTDFPTLNGVQVTHGGNSDAFVAKLTDSAENNPQTFVTSGAIGDVRGSTQEFTFGSDKPVSGFRCSMDGAPFLPCDQTESFSGLALGSHTLKVRAVDTDGNIDPTPFSAFFTIYNTAPLPDTLITGGPSGDVAETTQQFSFRGEPHEIALDFSCSLDGAAFTDCEPGKTYHNLSVGEHTFRVKLRDSHGTEDPTPAERTFTVVAGSGGTPPPTETTPTTGTTSTPPPAAEAPSIVLYGPDVLRYNETARLNAVVRAVPVARYAWDLDGNGSYERDTGSTPYADTLFASPGRIVVGVRATLDDGTSLTATKAITVTRPSALSISLSPGYPAAGQRVSFDVEEKTDGAPFRMFAWRFPGLPALDEDATVRPPARGRAAGSPSPFTTTVELDGATPSPSGAHARKLPRPGRQPVELTSLSPTGERLRTTFTVNLLAAGEKPRTTYPKVIDCDKWDGPGVCAGLTVPDPVLLDLPTSLQAVLPRAEFCVPANYTASNANDVLLKRVKSKLDLVNPPNDVVSNAANQSKVSGRARTRGAGARATPGVQEDCIGHDGEVISWDFGDGTKLPGGGNPAETAVKHTYTGAERDVTISYVARIFTVTMCHPNCKKADGNGSLASNFAKLTPVLVRLSRTVHLTTMVCGPRTLRGLRVTTTFAPAGHAAGGCFAKVLSADGKRTLYQTVYGARLDVAGVTVDADPPPWVETKAPLLVDETSGRIDAADASGLSFVGPGDKPTDGFSYTASVAGGVELTKSATHVLPAEGGSPSARYTISAMKFFPEPTIRQGLRPVAGFLADNLEFFLQPGRVATVRSWVSPPAPLTGPVPLITGGEPLAALRSTAEDDKHTDFKLDLGSKDFGFLRIDDVLLAHRVAGGWYGGGGMSIPSLGISVNAKYKRPPGFSPTQCEVPPGTGEIYGPSGFSLDYDNSFEFGGIGVFPESWNILGLAVTCIAIHGETDPLVLSGNFDGQWPAGPAKILGISGCLLFAKVEKGQPVPGCGTRVEAKNDYYWFRASAALDVLRVFTLDGYFDVRVGKIVGAPAGKDSIVEIRLGGGLDRLDLGPFYLKDLKVEGLAVIEPEFGFDVSARTRVCVVGMSAVIGLVAEGDGCVGVGGFVSSKGAMVCAENFGGWMQWKPLEAGLTSSCDLEASPLRVRGNTRGLRAFSVRGGDAHAAQLGGTAVKTVQVAGGLAKVGFHAVGVGGAPRMRVTDPSGAVIVGDTGDPKTAAPGVTGFTAAEAGEVHLAVKDPKPGAWKFESLPDTPPIQGLAALEPLVEPNVVARVAGTGAKRKLVYRARLAKGDRLRFEEHGDAMSRTLGTGRTGRFSLSMPDLATSPGKRTIRAIVEREGLPYKIFRVSAYSAPRLPTVGRPVRVKATQTKRGLAVTWKRAKLASEYVVSVRLTKKAVLRRTVAKPGALFPEVAPHAPAKVTVVAVDSLQRRGKPATASRKPTKAPKAVVKL